MSFFDPDVGAIPRGTAFVSLLSQRDLSLQLPIDYVTTPGVGLTAACFPAQRYEDTTAVKCLSNLLVMGFRRIEIEIYWDASRRLWSLCPVQLGDTNSEFNATTTANTQAAPTSSAILASGQLTGSTALRVRQAITSSDGIASSQSGGTSSILQSISPSVGANATSALPTVSTTATLSVGNSGTSILPTGTGSEVPTASEIPQNTLIEAGPYSCTSSATLELLTDVFSGYLQNTETDLNATTRYLILNLHAAAPASDPTGSPQQPAETALPQGPTLLSSVLLSNNSMYMYTPSELADGRTDLNATGHWLTSRSNYRPDPAYFTIDQSNGEESTPNGWPSEGLMELQRAKRLLVGYGTVDPQMKAYNFSADAQYIFPPGYLQAAHDVTTDGDTVTEGCLYQPGLEIPGPDNSSWAISILPEDTPQSSLAPLISNLTSCGLSPFLNTTLSNTSAAADYTPYQAFALSANWAWAPGEPRNATSSSSDSENVQYSCAALNATDGRWRASDCAQSHYGACRVGHTPFKWQISGQKGEYSNIDNGCGSNTSFSVPRTALENTYLIAAWRQHFAAESDPDDAMLWLNFNDLSTNACWVVGQNATCPYLPSENHVQGREIAVPVVAAVVVFVLAALTVFVKCAANRQNSKSKRRRRDDDGWEYEGVPS